MKKTVPAIETRDLSMVWGKLNVLKKINLLVNSGEKLAIVGPSGTGNQQY